MDQAAAPRLVGFANFKRHNPKSDKFGVKRFHHIEYWCGDATNTGRRWAYALGMQLVAKSDQTTSNGTYASYVYKSHDMVLVFTAPYGAVDSTLSKPPFPHFNANESHEFFKQHGVAARAIAVEVDDAAEAFKVAKENGGIPMLEPLEMVDAKTGQKATIAEIKLYLNGEVALRLVSYSKGYSLPFLPNYEPVTDAPPLNYGIKRIDHAVGNVHKLLPQIAYVQRFTGWHEFAEFTAEDVGTVDSGLNSLVLGNNSEMVLMPFNEPTFGTPRKSQIQTYLEQNNGEGLQHLALKTDDIFATMREMKKAGLYAGFEFMPSPNEKYYQELPERIGNVLTADQYKELQELGLLADKDDQGVLLQIFTKPCSDRPTFFIEIIQRIGCMVKDEETEEIYQAGGCGGFGKGNFSYLFKSIEDYERTLIASEQRH